MASHGFTWLHDPVTIRSRPGHDPAMTRPPGQTLYKEHNRLIKKEK